MISKETHKDIWTSIIMLVISIFIYFQSLNIRSFKGALSEGDPGLAFLPKLIAIFLAIFAVINLIIRFKQDGYLQFLKSISNFFMSLSNGALFSSVIRNKSLIGSMLLLIAYPFVLTSWGFLISSTILLILLLALISKMKWHMIVIASVSIVVPIFFLFEKLFKIQLP